VEDISEKMQAILEEILKVSDDKETPHKDHGYDIETRLFSITLNFKLKG
jgi:hypothetical protein